MEQANAIVWHLISMTLSYKIMFGWCGHPSRVAIVEMHTYPILLQLLFRGLINGNKNVSKNSLVTAILEVLNVSYWCS